ncbi:MAG: methylenetetrahydrofolate dehydrogenase (NADP+) / methenyltetrahydrofolate cyclohydrolase [Candidatus Berkelbacteria bacterium Licking1014_7]|uniref:Bifunctional protein FolD n=1 Tax=Candidatus Berkelbacteria bacterium Licking1014_7 TaxID=2017147 RepID=A0A554LIY3_9BACT|nr:MAG: methylenetetrahydrofolate dehydrogenase (NADP+) / methenyltetrahydrofolate cyclohydrolase [Candidatus Berkelbacteria bacterium Licking1014_7]
MKLLSGELIAQKIILQVGRNISQLCLKPRLDILVCQNDPISRIYLNKKKQMAQKAGIEVVAHNVKNPDTNKYLALIDILNQDRAVNGILAQLPLPKNVDLKKIIWRIDGKKDVDGFQMKEFQPPTPAAIIEILRYYNIAIAGKKIHILGRGFLVGKPLEILLKKMGARVSISDILIRKRELIKNIKNAQIVVSAMGKSDVLKIEWFHKNQIVIDAGTSVQNGAQKGDVGQQILEKVSAGTPTPGGVGPVSVACLTRNVYQAAIKQMMR